MKKHLCAVVLAITFLGCKEEPAKPVQQAGPAPATPAAQPKRPAYKPTYTIAIEPTTANPPRYIVKWTAKVNTGGWKLIVDSKSVEERHAELRAASIYATLEAPAENQTVTEAFETLTGEFDAGPQKIDKADLHVRRTIRDQKTDFKPLYSIVATVGKQF